MALAQLLLLVSLAAPEPTLGCFKPAWPSISALATHADTIALAKQMLVTPPLGEERCGQLVAGYLLALTTPQAEDEWGERQTAIDLLNAALRGNEGEPRLFFAMGIAYSHSGFPDAMRLLGRAKDRMGNAQPAFSNHELAVLHYIYAIDYQNQWMMARSRGDFLSTASGEFHCPYLDKLHGAVASFDAFFYLCSQTWDEVAKTFWRDWRESARPIYESMIDEFETISRLEPAEPAPLLELLGEYYYSRDFEPAYDLIRRMLKASPNDPNLLAIAGAIYHATGRDSVAETLFNRAFATMPAADRRVYEDIKPLLRRDDSVRFASVDSVAFVRGAEAFWRSEDPLFLTSYNERRLEHYARVATVDLLFAVPRLKQHGWDTDGGQIWIRYGRPRDIYELDPRSETGGRSIYWVYDSHGLRFAFHRNLASRRYRLDETGQMNSEDLKNTLPERGTAFFADSGVVLDHQLVRLLGADNKPQILLYTPWPPDFPRSTSVGLTLMDGDFQPVAQWRGTRTSREGVGAELDALGLGRFALAFEIWNPAYRRLARIRDTVTVVSYANGLVLSDILLATRIRSRRDGPATVKADLDITPAYGTTLHAGTPIGLYWETYGLTPDSSGVRRYEVQIELKRGGGDLPTRVLRGLSGIFGGNRSTTVRYEGTALGSRSIDWLELEPPAQRGDYIVHLTVTDRVTGKVTITQRSFSIQ